MALKERVIKDIPDGWKKIEGATTAPKGYSWYCNGKSLFSGEYESVLVKDKSDEIKGEV